MGELPRAIKVHCMALVQMLDMHSVSLSSTATASLMAVQQTSSRCLTPAGSRGLACALLPVRRRQCSLGSCCPHHLAFTLWHCGRFFYSFDALPELLVLCIDCWPMLYARIGQAYPKPLGADEESSRHDSSHNGDRAGKHEADGLDERERENGSNNALKEQ